MYDVNTSNVLQKKFTRVRFLRVYIFVHSVLFWYTVYIFVQSVQKMLFLDPSPSALSLSLLLSSPPPSPPTPTDLLHATLIS